MTFLLQSMRSASSILLLGSACVALAGCPRQQQTTQQDAAPTPVVPSVAASTTSTTKPPPSPSVAAELPRSSHTFTGTIGKDTVFSMALEALGDRVEGVYVTADRSVPSRVKGALRPDGGLHLDEPGEKGGTAIDARISGTTLKGKWTDKGTKKSLPLEAGPLRPFTTDKDFTQSFVGTLGKATRVRARLTRQGLQVTGVYRYTQSRNDLRLVGPVSQTTGHVDLTETDTKGKVTGRFDATFLSPNVLVGNWISPDGGRVLPLLLEQSDMYPESVRLTIADAPSARLVPTETFDQRSPYCSSTVITPQFEGLPKEAAQKTLNQALRAAAGKPITEPDACVDASDDSPIFNDRGFNATRSTGRFIGVRIGWYASGGAHPNWGGDCWVANTTSGQLFRLATLLTKDGKAKLSELASKKLRDKHQVKDLTEVGFYADPIALEGDPDLCMTENGIELFLDPYDAAPYVLGGDQLRFTREELRSILASPDLNELTGATKTAPRPKPRPRL